MEPSKQIVEAELDHILASPQIANSSVLSEFLKFIVHETLEGRSQELKEYTIGINVLKRDTDFNPQIDSIVRIHAGRLRRALKEYYYEEGQEDALVISIPKGGYVPSFQMKSRINGKPIPEKVSLNGAKGTKTGNEKEGTIPLTTAYKLLEELVIPEISLVVLPFKHIGHGEEGTYFSQSISDYISTELTLFDAVHVVASYFGNGVISITKDIREVCVLLEADYVLTGSVHFYENKVRVWVQLINNRGEQLWAHTFEKNDPNQNLWEYQDSIVGYLLAYVMGINGVILRDQFRKITDNSDFSNPVLPIYWYAQYDTNLNVLFIKKAKVFFNKLIEKEPDNALAHAYLSMILIGELLLLPKAVEETIKLASLHAHLSLKLDPLCQQAYVAVATNYLALHEKDRCVHILEKGLKVNPRNFDYQNAMGAIFFSMGEFDRGAELLDRNYQINPNVLRWQKISYTYYLYHQKKYKEAIFLAEQLDFDGIWISILKAAAFGQLGLFEEGQTIIDQLEVKYPKVDVSRKEALKRFFCSERFIDELLVGLRKLIMETVK